MYAQSGGTLMDFSKIKITETQDSLEISDIHGLFAEHHELGDCRARYERVYQIVEYRGEWIGALLWDQTAKNNRVRDKRIGWEEGQKAQRRKYVINNKRFLLSEKYKGEKNLASHILGAATKQLSELWDKKYGHPVLLAETYVDPSRHEGTCYEAAGWEYVGLSSGYKKPDKESGRTIRSNRKKYYIKPLCKGGCEMLSAPFPHAKLSGTKPLSGSNNTYVYDINKLDLSSLKSMLGGVPDPRSEQGRRYEALPMLTLTVAALLAGQQGYKQIHHWTKSLPDECLERVGIRHRRVPSLSTLREYLMQLDYEVLRTRIYQWLSVHHRDLLDQHEARRAVIALDGKQLRGTKSDTTKAVQALNILAVDLGVVLDQHRVSNKTNEIPVAQKALEARSDLEGKVVVADALHTQKKTARLIVKKKSGFRIHC